MLLFFWNFFDLFNFYLLHNALTRFTYSCVMNPCLRYSQMCEKSSGILRWEALQIHEGEIRQMNVEFILPIFWIFFNVEYNWLSRKKRDEFFRRSLAEKLAVSDIQLSERSGPRRLLSWCAVIIFIDSLLDIYNMCTNNLKGKQFRPL